MPENPIKGKSAPNALGLRTPPVAQAFGLAPRALSALVSPGPRNAGAAIFHPPTKPVTARLSPPPAIQAFGLAPRALQSKGVGVHRPGPLPISRTATGKIVQPKIITPRRASSVAPAVFRPKQQTIVQPAMISPIRPGVAAKASQRTAFPFYGPRGGVVQRMQWVRGNYMSESSDESEDISVDEDILLTASPNLHLWRAGVAIGYNEGWDDGVDSERILLNPTPPLLVALQTTGGPLPGNILALQNNPPLVYIMPGDEQDEGEAYGRAQGFNAGSATAFRVLSWSRQNYPAIPAFRQATALAQNGGQCVYCNAAPSTQVDHVYPIQKHWVTLGYMGANLGEVNDASNLVGSCGPCNGGKSNTYLNNWNGHAWMAGAWFPFGPGTIPQRRGGPIAPGNW